MSNAFYEEIFQVAEFSVRMRYTKGAGFQLWWEFGNATPPRFLNEGETQILESHKESFLRYCEKAGLT